MSRLGFSWDTDTKLIESGLDVVVTGGGGWLGQATLEMLETSLGRETSARVHVFASSRRSMRLRSKTELEVFPLKDLPRLTVGPHLLAHYAFATRELVAQLGHIDYVSHNREITGLVADHVARTRPVGMLMMSSGAVYLGDQLASNPYGVLKAREERRFSDVVATLGQTGPAPRAVVPRLFNLAGPFLNKPDRYVLGSILRDIAKGGPIQLHATHPVVRSYVHVRDLVDLAFAVMLGEGPAPFEPFDTAGDREIEVGDLAKLAAAVMGKPEMPINRPPLDHTEADRYVGDSEPINALARLYGVEMSSLPRQIEDTAAFMNT
jgi:UDP-glucuronate decarboxylase